MEVGLNEFLDMKKRFEEFYNKNKREPRYVTTKNGYKVMLPVFKDMLNRYYKFKAENGREPKKITVSDLDDEGWVMTGFFREDKQDLGVTCGPSSLQMALSSLGCKVDEKFLAEAGGTGSKGTGHDGMLQAINKASLKCGVKLKADFVDFYKTGWVKVADLLRDGAEVVIHLRPLPFLRYDVYGRHVWVKFSGGHYVYLVGVNLSEKRVMIADPTKGLNVFGFDQMVGAMEMVGQSSLLVIRKL